MWECGWVVGGLVVLDELGLLDNIFNLLKAN